jgi:hypothetical protein
VQTTEPCRICREPIQKWDVYCHECAQHVRTMHELTTREEHITDACTALGWTVNWHGPTMHRWCLLFRLDGSASCSVSMDLAGTILHSETKGKVKAERFARWLSGLVGALEV